MVVAFDATVRSDLGSWGGREIQNGEPFRMIWLSLPGESTHTVLGNNPAWMDRGWSPGLFDYVLEVAPEGLVALPVITPGRFRCKEQRDPGRVAPHFLCSTERNHLMGAHNLAHVNSSHAAIRLTRTEGDV